MEETNKEPTTAPPPKRRRILRACAACRRRKIKCNGEAPCASCVTHNLTCSYEEDDRRRSTPGYIQTLERRVRELETLLGNADDLSEEREEEEQNPSKSATRSSRSGDDPTPTSQAEQTEPTDGDDVLETMVGTSEDDTHSSSNPEKFWGNFSGLSLLQRMRRLCSDVAGLQRDSEGDAVEDDFIHAFDSASPPEKKTISWESFALLPSKERLLDCVTVAVDEATCNLQFIDRKAVEEVVDHMYDTERDEYDEKDRKSLAYLYALLALGRRFEPTRTDKETAGSPTNAAFKGYDGFHQGMRYFRASRNILDIADCHDIISLQTVLCLIIYLQASYMMSTCYSYICAAVAASLRMGLHATSTCQDLPQSERETRRRVFAVLNILDTYVTVALGLPKTLREVNSDYLHPPPETGLLPPNASCNFGDHDARTGATFAHAKLINILAKAVEMNHPVTKPIRHKNGFYGVEYGNIITIENELGAWFSELPQTLDHEAERDKRYMRSQLLLRLSYAHVQMVLYRPFLHHASKSLRPYREIRYRAYACGSACVKAAMQVVWLAEALEQRGLFNEAIWFTTLIVSFAATSLMLFVLSNEGDPTIQETADAAERVKNLLAKHADRSVSARRCSQFLQELSEARKTGTFAGQNLGLLDNPGLGNPQGGPEKGIHDFIQQSQDESGDGGSVNSDQDYTLEAMTYPRLHPYLDETF